jgi:hypothetical protein
VCVCVLVRGGGGEEGGRGGVEGLTRLLLRRKACQSAKPTCAINPITIYCRRRVCGIILTAIPVILTAIPIIRTAIPVILTAKLIIRTIIPVIYWNLHQASDGPLPELLPHLKTAEVP